MRKHENEVQMEKISPYLTSIQSLKGYSKKEKVKSFSYLINTVLAESKDKGQDINYGIIPTGLHTLLKDFKNK